MYSQSLNLAHDHSKYFHELLFREFISLYSRENIYLLIGYMSLKLYRARKYTEKVGGRRVKMVVGENL